MAPKALPVAVKARRFGCVTGVLGFALGSNFRVGHTSTLGSLSPQFGLVILRALLDGSE